ncbi:hypothetical protein [Elizabethkingia miricola]|uniref:hypothetical protein n=1 Tax=Elizabethkingia miricola TaxID=172045 RepID=UPI0038925E7D
MKKIILVISFISGTLYTQAQEVIQLTNNNTKEIVNFRQIDKWADGSVMNDSKVDGIYYRKKSGIYYVDTNFIKEKNAYVNDYSLLLGKDNFVKISQAFPTVTLNEVKKYNTNATLNNSAEWYIVSKLLDVLPTGSTIVFNGKYNFDLPIVIKRSRITLRGVDNSAEARSWLSRSTLKSINSNDLIQFVDGDGKTNTTKGNVELVNLDNLTLLGSGDLKNYSRYGINFNFSSAGTLIGSTFTNIYMGNFMTGVKHTSGHINSLKFQEVSSNANIDKGFDFIGDQNNQVNAVIFERGGASSNGYKIEKGNLVAITKADDYSGKGGFFIKGGTALNFIGMDFTTNNGYGMNFGNSHAYGCSFKFYSEGNFVDFRYQITLKWTKSLDLSFYSKNNTVVFDDPAVKAKYYKE